MRFIRSLFFQWCLVLICMFLAWQRFILLEPKVGFWGDEALTLLSSVNFWKTGVFSSALGMTKGFEKTVSSGLISVWPTGLGWLAGGNIFWARAAFFYYHLALIVTLVLLAIRTLKIRFEPIWIGIALLIYPALMNFVPYAWATGVANVGELSGAIFLGFGFIFMRTRPLLSAFLFGLCVWHTKFIFIPFALVGLCSLALASPLRALQTGCFFVLPIAAWVLWIFIVRGKVGLVEYFTLQESMSFRLFKAWSASGGENGIPLELGFFDRLALRLQSPILEWKAYALPVKLKILGLGVGPIFLSVWLGILSWRRKESFRNLTIYFGLAGVFGIFAVWYFEYHLFMWIRHYQPALLAGFGFWLWLTLRGYLKIPKQYQYSALMIALVLLGGREMIRVPDLILQFKDPEYPKRYSLQCALSPASQLSVFFLAEKCCPPTGDAFNATMHKWYDGAEIKK